MRSLTFLMAALLLASTIFASASAQANAQAVPGRTYGLGTSQTSLLDLGADYVNLHANAPPSGCGCFSLNGGGAIVALNLPHGVSLIGDLSGAHASQVNGTAQNITLTNFLFGPRLTLRFPRRAAPYAQFLLGASHESSNYAYVHSVSAFALQTGLGFNVRLTPHLQWNALEADYLYSQLPNAVNSYQNDLRITTGFSLRFAPR